MKGKKFVIQISDLPAIAKAFVRQAGLIQYKHSRGKKIVIQIRDLIQYKRSRETTLVMLLFTVFISCNINPSFEKNIEIPNYKWDYTYTPSFTFLIDDTSAVYNFYVNVRHLDAYPYSNMWVWVHQQQPDGKQTHQRVQLKLAEADGKWGGNGLNGVWMVSLPYKQFTKLPARGEYHFSIEQDMRINPLPAVMDMGLKVEKIAKK